jgi:hypothetical protein
MSHGVITGTYVNTEVIHGMDTIENMSEKQVLGWLAEMNQKRMVPVMMIGLIADGRSRDVDIWCPEKMKMIDMRIIIQWVIERIYILEIENKEVMKCINGR